MLTKALLIEISISRVVFMLLTYKTAPGIVNNPKNAAPSRLSDLEERNLILFNDFLYQIYGFSTKKSLLG